ANVETLAGVWRKRAAPGGSGAEGGAWRAHRDMASGLGRRSACRTGVGEAFPFPGRRMFGNGFGDMRMAPGSDQPLV
ncbi:hypothetical protein DQE80_17905, partial [Enterococcus sp. HPCN18]